jgi:hypothetical protein
MLWNSLNFPDLYLILWNSLTFSDSLTFPGFPWPVGTLTNVLVCNRMCSCNSVLMKKMVRTHSLYSSGTHLFIIKMAFTPNANCLLSLSKRIYFGSRFRDRCKNYSLESILFSFVFEILKYFAVIVFLKYKIWRKYFI